MSIPNSSNGYGPGIKAHPLRWCVFDELPKEVRDFINYRDFNIAVEPLIADNIQQHGAERVIEATRQMFNEKKRQDFYIVWNNR